jgi:para-aminobenzoate synthetase component 1
LTRSEFVDALNDWGRTKTSFLFIIDFEEERPFAIEIDKVDPGKILFDFNGFTNVTEIKYQKAPALKKLPMPFAEYNSRFAKVRCHLERGDSFLTNLTIKTKIDPGLTLLEIFHAAQAKYKVWFEDSFIFFSPESFVSVQEGIISSYPMKGTIDAAITNAKEIILSDPKETAEHITIVDLIRNDLSQVATSVAVKKFRYIDEIRTSHGALLQVSSEIEGVLDTHYSDHLGDLVMRLLPAGSVSGAPKSKTIEIIRESEGERRGYYTGVCGYFDGVKMDSCVMIRFIEKDGDGLFYRSGGGITTQSDARREYEEAIEKIYVPLN